MGPKPDHLAYLNHLRYVLVRSDYLHGNTHPRSHTQHCRYRIEDEATLKHERLMKHDEILALQSVMGESEENKSPKAPAHGRSTWAQRLPKSMFIGKKFGVIGRSSPGPAYSVPPQTKYVQKSRPPYIPVAKHFTV